MVIARYLGQDSAVHRMRLRRKLDAVMMSSSTTVAQSLKLTAELRAAVERIRVATTAVYEAIQERSTRYHLPEQKTNQWLSEVEVLKSRLLSEVVIQGNDVPSSDYGSATRSIVALMVGGDRAKIMAKFTKGNSDASVVAAVKEWNNVVAEAVEIRIKLVESQRDKGEAVLSNYIQAAGSLIDSIQQVPPESGPIDTPADLLRVAAPRYRAITRARKALEEFQDLPDGSEMLGAARNLSLITSDVGRAEATASKRSSRFREASELSLDMRGRVENLVDRSTSHMQLLRERRDLDQNGADPILSPAISRLINPRDPRLIWSDHGRLPLSEYFALGAREMDGFIAAEADDARRSGFREAWILTSPLASRYPFAFGLSTAGDIRSTGNENTQGSTQRPGWQAPPSFALSALDALASLASPGVEVSFHSVRGPLRELQVSCSDTLSRPESTMATEAPEMVPWTRLSRDEWDEGKIFEGRSANRQV